MPRSAIDLYPLRNPRLVLMISEYTETQLDDFKRTGIELFLERLSLSVKRISSAEIEELERQVELVAQNKAEEEKKRIYNLPWNVEARELAEQKQIEKIKKSQLIDYSYKIAGEWRKSGHEMFLKQDRFLGANIVAYFNKYDPESELDKSDLPNLMTHLAKNIICLDKECSKDNICDVCEEVKQREWNGVGSFLGDQRMSCAPSTEVSLGRVPKIVFKQDSKKPLQLNAHCTLCDEKLDSFELIFNEIDVNCLDNQPRIYSSMDLNNHLTKIELALIKNIGDPLPISGIYDGIERSKPWNWRRDSKLDYNNIISKGKNRL